jgi:hypothetical protein
MEYAIAKKYMRNLGRVLQVRRGGSSHTDIASERSLREVLEVMRRLG